MKTTLQRQMPPAFQHSEIFTPGRMELLLSLAEMLLIFVLHVLQFTNKSKKSIAPARPPI
jgi:hypothetical protein